MNPLLKRPASASTIPLLSLLTVAALAAGCSGGSAGDPASGHVPPRPADGGTAALKFFEGETACARLEAHIEDSLLAGYGENLEQQRRYSGSGEGVTYSPAPAPVSAPAAGTNYSTTTIRTAGVDEADPVKNDGNRILTLKSTPDGTVLSRVDLGGAGRMSLIAQTRWPSVPASAEQIEGLYLPGGDRAVALTTTRHWQGPPMPAGGWAGSGGWAVAYGPGAQQAATSRLRVVDLNSPTLATTWETTVPGALLGSRRIGDRLYLVTQAAPLVPEGVKSWADVRSGSSSAVNAAVDAQLEANERLIRAVDLATWLAPMGQQGQPSNADCASYARIDAPSPLGFLRVTTVDIGARTLSSRTALGQASGLYLSGRSLILLSADWDGGGARTYLHRFVADNAGAFDYHGSGTIQGQLINQYAIDETAASIIRVAVRGNGHTYLATLEPAAAPAPWRELGRSGEIARGETLQSARFVGDRAYLVTFLQVDPFFVYDLSDPTRPTELGELKIPGYSTWLHPVGSNHVLGVGHGEGSPREIKASLFDVTDPKRPVEQSTLILGSSYTASDALWDPHAFTWYSPATPIPGLPTGDSEGSFAVPVRSYRWDASNLSPESSVRIVSVRPSAGSAALSLNGSISLTDRLVAGYTNSWEGWRPSDARRAVFVDSTAYAIADDVIRSAPIATPAATIETLVLP